MYLNQLLTSRLCVWGAECLISNFDEDNSLAHLEDNNPYFSYSPFAQN